MQHLTSLTTEPVFWWTAVGSTCVFVASLVAVPWVIVRLPANYFSHRRRVVERPKRGAAYYLLVVMKNLAGAVFVVMGIAMLVLPGQGILTIVVGVSLVNFPGKYRLERYLVSRRVILKALNWVRQRAGKPHFQVTSLQ